MKRAWQWAVGALSAVTAVILFLLYRKYQQDHVNTLKDALEVAKAERAIATLDARREAVDERVAAREDDIEAVDLQLAENRRKIVEARTGAKQLSREAVLAEYRRLGYL